MFTTTWTQDEIELLARHKIPPGRSLNGARAKAKALHIPFRPSDPHATASDTPVWVPRRRSWTDADVAKIKEKVVPEGHSLSSVRSYASAHHIPFNRIRRRQTPQKEKVALLRDDIVKVLQSTGNIRATSRKFGLAYTSVRNIAIEIGLVA